MKRLILLLFLGMGSTAFGQITISASQFLTGFTSGQATGRAYTSEDMTGLSALVAAAGANQSWDFGGRVYTEVPTVPGANVEVFTFPGTAPFANDPDFATSTHVIKTSTGSSDLGAVWLYVRFTDQGYWMVGSAYDSMGTTKKLNAYVPPMQQYAFPLTYQTEWHSTSTFKNENYPSEYVITQQVDAKVDGYGSLILPTKAGKPNHSPASTTEALRIETKNTQSITVNSIPILSSVTYDYEWMTLSQYAATITTNDTKEPTSVSYSTPGSGGSVSMGENALEIKLSANPAIAETSISLMLAEPTTINVSVLDVLGNTVEHVAGGLGHQGQNVIPLTVHSLPNGTYFIRVDAGDIRTMKKLVVSR